MIPKGLLFVLGLSACSSEQPGTDSTATAPVRAPTAGATYLGSQSCVACHRQQSDLWQGSHHDLAMAEAGEDTVLGDFDDATFEHGGITSTFTRRDGAYVVRTEGEDASLRDFEVAYTFGVTPLQQYLIPMDRGRLQALSIAWDARAREDGGQRWFHLYPEESLPPEDRLHWTGLDMNWNFMCAECHSTNLEKNYDTASNSYDTSWSEIDVACEACHGPASDHVTWARAAGTADAYEAPMSGLTVRLREENEAEWVMDPATGVAHRSRERLTRPQLDVCARCHSRRSSLSGAYRHQAAFLDGFRPALLEEHLYFDDGQIRDEVYVWGSFLQSKMYNEGVTCSDCHDPHSLRVRGEGNSVCAGCHLQTTFDTPEHHHHQPGTPGAACVECHMPERTYMQVDPRRDHSLRVPRPDLAATLAAPDACTGCHQENGAEWAAAAARRWWGEARSLEPHYGEVFRAARAGRAGADRNLARLVADAGSSGIVRATAMDLLADFRSRELLPAVELALHDPEPLLRAAAAGAGASIEPAQRVTLISPLLSDSVRAVRVEAAHSLVSAPAELLDRAQSSALEGALSEYEAAQWVNADRPEAWLNLALVAGERGDLAEARSSYERALELDPRFLPAFVNLADLHRLQGADDKGELLLRQALEIAPENAETHHSLGLLLARQQRLDEAIVELERAVVLGTADARYSYVYGVALESVGRVSDALETLEQAHYHSPTDGDILIALVTYARKDGRSEQALAWARKLVELEPRDPNLQNLVRQIEREVAD